MTTRRPRALALSPDPQRLAELRLRLRSAGFEVWESCSPLHAWVTLGREGAMDVVLLDATSSGALGLARDIRSERAYDGVRLLLLTSELRVDELLRAMDAGVDGCLPWPFSEATLEDKLAELGVSRRSHSASSGSRASRG